MYVVYEVATGRLASQTDSAALIANPLPAGYTSKQVTDPAAGSIWDTVALNFVAAPAPRKIDKTTFINRFTQTELRSLFGFQFGTATTVQKQNVYTFISYLQTISGNVDLDATAIQTGVNYLETTAGVLSAGRAAVILA